MRKVFLFLATVGLLAAVVGTVFVVVQEVGRLGVPPKEVATIIPAPSPAPTPSVPVAEPAAPTAPLSPPPPAVNEAPPVSAPKAEAATPVPPPMVEPPTSPPAPAVSSQALDEPPPMAGLSPIEDLPAPSSTKPSDTPASELNNKPALPAYVPMTDAEIDKSKKRLAVFQKAIDTVLDKQDRTVVMFFSKVVDIEKLCEPVKSYMLSLVERDWSTFHHELFADALEAIPSPSDLKPPLSSVSQHFIVTICGRYFAQRNLPGLSIIAAQIAKKISSEGEYNYESRAWLIVHSTKFCIEFALQRNRSPNAPVNKWDAFVHRRIFNDMYITFISTDYPPPDKEMQAALSEAVDKFDPVTCLHEKFRVAFQ